MAPTTSDLLIVVSKCQNSCKSIVLLQVVFALIHLHSMRPILVVLEDNGRRSCRRGAGGAPTDIYTT